MAKRYKTVQHTMMRKIDSAKETLQKIPNVLAVGIGLKETDGEFTDEIAYRVFVPEKKPKSELKKHEIIPAEIDGHKTDVITPYHITNEAFVETQNIKDVRPIQGGIAMGNDKDQNAYGTLGWFAKLADNSLVILTNKHVLYDTTLETNTSVNKAAQAFYSKSCCCECGVIGQSIIGIKNATVDCAIASINGDIGTSLRITNDSTTQVLKVTGTAQAVIGNVRKIGARSIFTKGKIVHIGDTAAAPTDPAGGAITIQPDQLIIIPASDETYQSENGKFAFSNHGDSGSAIIDDDNKMVGLLWGGDATSNSVKLTWANNIDKVITALTNAGHAITIATSPDGGEKNFVQRKKSKVLQSNQPSLTKLQQMVPKEWSDVIAKHRPEVMRLINTSKKTGTVWQRYQGPAFTVHFMNSMNDPDYVIPKEIKNINFTTLLIKMGDVLKECGSDALKQSISEYGFTVISAAEDASSVKDFILKLNNTVTV
jgi:hypothetical protein